jgi:hypothetical protein
MTQVKDQANTKNSANVKKREKRAAEKETNKRPKQEELVNEALISDPNPETNSNLLSNNETSMD